MPTNPFTPEQQAWIQNEIRKGIEEGILFGQARPELVAKVNNPSPSYYYRLGYDPKGKPLRIIHHWTGGTYTANSLEKEHYHFLIEHLSFNEARVLKGIHPVSNNNDTSDDDYAAHTRRYNTHSIGIGWCGMLGAKRDDRGVFFGNFPLTREQWTMALRLSCDLCNFYNIRAENVMSHFEVSLRGGPKQPDKWDISSVSWNDRTGVALMDDFRDQLKRLLAQSQ